MGGGLAGGRLGAASDFRHGACADGARRSLALPLAEADTDLEPRHRCHTEVQTRTECLYMLAILNILY